MKNNSNSLVGFFALIAVATLLSACSGSKDASPNLEKARAYVDAGEYASAEIEIRNALSKDSGNTQALALQGKIFFEQGRFRDSYRVLFNLNQNDPSDAESLAMLAAIQASAGMADKAAENARAALSIDPSNLQALIALVETARDSKDAEAIRAELAALPQTASNATAQGALSFKSGDIDSAQAKFTEALSIDPGIAEAHSGMFLVHASKQEVDKAGAAIKKAAETSKARSSSKIRYASWLQQHEGEQSAIEYLDRILIKAPDYLPALNLQAEYKMRAGDLAEANKLVERALKLDPIEMTALWLKGLISFSEGNVEESIEELKRLLELYPDNLQANYQIALAYLKNKDNSAAKKHLLKVSEARPQNLEANALLSGIQSKEGDYAGAIITLENFLKANPNSIEGRMLLAEVFNKKGDFTAALAIYQALEKAAPKDPTLNYLSGVSFLNANDSKKARNSFETVLENNPNHLQSIEYLTAIDLKENNSADALQRIEQAISAGPENSALHAIRGQILQNTGNPAEAKLALEKAIEIDPKNESARLLLARILRSQGNTEQAIAILEETIEIDPQNVAALATIAGIYEEAKRYPEAIESYERILTIAPNNVRALNNLSYIYSSHQNNIEKAFELAERARAVAPNDPYLADTLGWIAFKRGDYAWALSLLQESYDKLPNIQEIAYHLGSAYYALGKRSESIEFMTKATLESDSYVGFEDAKQKLSILKLDPQEHSDTAAKQISTVLQQHENEPFALVYLANVHNSNGEIDKALENYGKALETNPYNLEAQIGMARSLVSVGKLDQAAEYADKAEKQDPNNPSVLGIQGQVAFKKRDFDWAANRFSKQITLAPDDLATLKTLTLSHFAIGDLSSASRRIDELNRLDKSDEFNGWQDLFEYLRNRSLPPPHGAEISGPIKALLVGYEALQSQDLLRAETSFKTVLQDYPQQIQAKLGLAEVLSYDPSNNEAFAKLVSDAREKDSSDLHAKALEAISLLQKGKTAQALRAAKSIDPSNRMKLGAALEARISKIADSE